MRGAASTSARLDCVSYVPRLCEPDRVVVVSAIPD